MKDTIKCPVCGKSGIPNFHAEDVVCPCCGSDLSIYHNLNELSCNDTNVPTATKRHKHTVMSLVFTIVLLLAIGGCILTGSLKKHTTSIQKIDELEAQNNILTDSITNLNKTVATFKSKPTNNTGKEYRTYVVIKGDSFCRISSKLYGTEKRYQEIAKLNNLDVNTKTLHPGDSLKVRVK